MQVIAPNVSTDFIFFTITFLSYSLCAVSAKASVRHESKPSGTLATIIPKAKTKFVITGKLRPKPDAKNITPKEIAITAIILMNLFISCSNVNTAPSALDAKSAILPLKVLFPVFITTTFPSP